LLKKKNNNQLLKSIPNENFNTPSKTLHRQILQSDNMTPRKLEEKKELNDEND